MKTRKKKVKTPGLPVCYDLVRRSFTAEGPNQLSLDDINKYWTNDGQLHLSTIKDAFTRRVVGYSLSDHMKARLTVDAPDSAAARNLDIPRCVVCSDRGSQFRGRKFIHVLSCHALVGPMGRVGASGGQRRHRATGRSRYGTNCELTLHQPQTLGA